MSDTDSSPDQLDLLFAVPGDAPSVPTAKVSPQLLMDSDGDLELPSSEEARQRALQRFTDLLRNLTPITWVTPLLLISCVGVYVAMVAQGVSLWLPSSMELRNWGANYSPLTWGGQPWRLVSNLFVHCGILHLVFNMWALWNIGRFLEKLIGNVGLLIVYFVSGTLGSIVSLWWNGDVVSAGASGAIFGLLGALATFLWNRSDSVPLAPLAAIRGSIGTCIFYNLLFGATIEGIDQAAHVGGLLGGLVCGLLLSQPLDQQTKQRRFTKNALTSAVCGLGLGIAIFQHPPAPPDFFLETEAYQRVFTESLQNYAEVTKKFDADQIARKSAFEEMEEKFARNEVSPKELTKWRMTNTAQAKAARHALAKWLEEELLPPWREIRQHFEALSNVPAGRRDHLHQLRSDLILREESWNLLIAALKSNDPDKWTEFQEKQKQAELIESKLRSRN